MPRHLTLAPNPQPHPILRTREEAARARNVRCIYTIGCLSIADAAGWQAFHCRDCTAYVSIDPEQLREDCARMATMIAACPRLPEPVNPYDPVRRQRRHWREAALARLRARSTGGRP